MNTQYHNTFSESTMERLNQVDESHDPEFDTILHPSQTNPQFLLPLPPLSQTPQPHPDSCLTLSLPLLNFLTTLLPPSPALTLSIGSGTSLPEALLLSSAPNLNIQTVEVSPSPNKYFPAHLHHTVPGTWALHPLAQEAEVWMFVYPRAVGLVGEYLRLFGPEEGKVRRILYLGPRADWVEYEECFRERGCGVRVWGAEEVGGRAWEVVAVADCRVEHERNVDTTWKKKINQSKKKIDSKRKFGPD